ncbi:MAG: clostripain-related cysteine peptidase [Candidatus Babeliales bacterium]
MRIIRIFMFISIFTLTTIVDADTWKVFFYMDSSDGLSDMAFKNITDMVRGKPNDNVEWLIQLHAYHKTGLRYRVTNAGLEFLEEIALTGDSKQDLIDAASWGFAEGDADHTMLILANHGWGILDPRWNPETEKWEVASGSLSNSCAIKRSRDWQVLHKNHRGFMFSTTPRVYLNNQDLIDGLAYIKSTILQGKLDVLAFDTCMGAMLEVAYQVAPFADYLVGVQSCSLMDGFDYQGVMASINQGPTPRDLVTDMVQVCDAYFSQHDASGVYTYTALDLSYAAHITKALDVVVTQLLSMPELLPIIMHAHDDAPRFCMWPMYTDLIAFCKDIGAQLNTLPSSDAITALQQSLQRLYRVSKQCVVNRCGGHTTSGHAHGFAIYLPVDMIDEPYYTTQFVRESQWINLLQVMAGLNTEAYVETEQSA